MEVLYGAFQAKSIRLFYFFFIQACYGWPQKNDAMIFRFCLKISLAAIVGIVVTLRAVTNPFEIYTLNSLIKKIETNFISIALFWVAQPKQKKLKSLFLELRWSSHFSCVRIFFSIFRSSYFKTYFPKFIIQIYLIFFLNTFFYNYIAAFFF